MNLIPCRDCQTPVPADARGCPRCARNLSAERALGRLLALVVTAAALILVGLLVWLLVRTAG
jgi:predicted nucleic acid-binding Zn ribbon protein